MILKYAVKCIETYACVVEVIYYKKVKQHGSLKSLVFNLWPYGDKTLHKLAVWNL
jgi:hypothetical protein